MSAVAEKDATEHELIEQPVDVDAHAGLFGILTKPTRATSDTGFIIINAGLLHRVGPFRLYVDIARRIAACGFPSIRLDQSGKGDSNARRGVPLTETTIADVTAAAAYLERETGTRRFVAGGLCSGGDDALQAASDIAGLRGLFMFDGYAPKTLRYYVRRYGPKLFSVQAWLKHLRSNSGEATAEQDIVNLRNWATRAEMMGQYRALVEQGIKILAVFTSGSSGFYNYPSQLTATLGHANAHTLVTERYYPEACHLFPVTEHRRDVVEEFAEWADRSFDSIPDC